MRPLGRIDGNRACPLTCSVPPIALARGALADSLAPTCDSSCQPARVKLSTCGMRVSACGMSGGVKNVFAHDCRISKTMRGIRIKSMRGRGGYVKDVRFENLEINDTEDQALQITMFYDATTVEPKADTPSDFSNIVIRGVKGKGLKAGIQLAGLPEHRMSHIMLDNIELEAENAMECVDVESLTMKDVRINSPHDTVL